MEFKLLEAEGRLLGRPTTAIVISLSGSYLLDRREAESSMEDFLQHTSIILTPSTTQ